jgi:hypothetical protein
MIGSTAAIPVLSELAKIQTDKVRRIVRAGRDLGKLGAKYSCLYKLGTDEELWFHDGYCKGYTEYLCRH